jgi:hypothetical protein
MKHGSSLFARTSPRNAARIAATLITGLVVVLALAQWSGNRTASATAATDGVAPNAIGALDCNGLSPIQKPARHDPVCTDIHAFYDGQPSRFTDNGKYVGHDEPSIRFLSDVPGSGNNVTWNERLPLDPAAAPTVATPGSDVTHWFELSVAPWFGMALCNPYSYPQTACKPESDSNAPRNPPTFNIGGGGSSFLEVQFYPPGFAPFVDNISCDNTHWCASLHINDAECTLGFHYCNPNCIEPTNFAFIQMDGIPTGPPSPQLSNLATQTPNVQTLLMNPGDNISVHIFDAHTPGGLALEVHIQDFTTGKSGFMQASAANGFMATNLGNCKGIPFSYTAEYNTAQPQNIVPWAALQGGILTQFEIGHFTPCTSVSDPATLSIGTFTDTFFQTCNGPYEAEPDGGANPEVSDAPCYPLGDTHGGVAPPNQVAGCAEFFTQNGDLDFDGTSYRANWPNSTTPTTFPSTFQQQQPTSNGHPYPFAQFETDAAASESTCGPATLSGCAVPPPGSPGNFYPYWTQALVSGKCVWEFGQMTNGNTFGGDAQYDGPSAYFFGTLSGPIIANPNCS